MLDKHTNVPFTKQSNPTILPFSQESLDAIIQKTIVPATDGTHSNAVVVATDTNGIALTAAFRKNLRGNWILQAQGDIQHNWDGSNIAGVNLRILW